MLSTMDLKYIKDELGENIFDFDYDWEDITIGDKVYSKEYIQNNFIDYWLYYHIGYSTLDEFKWRLRRNWLNKIEVLKQQLSLYPTKLNLNEYNINRTYSSKSDNKYSDTPNQPMLDVDPEGKYLTDRTYNDLDGNSNVTETKNELAKYNELKNKAHNVLYDWIKSYDYLFLTDVLLYNKFVYKRSI